ncbi:MAG TPA: hypothetical protein VH351_02240 [Bryobacteraceae bacterium]|jgi:hypothetical protein|nr:hypothetical protein [Bryobacteraceae bacterium]
MFALRARLLLLFIATAAWAPAHNGPPFPIITNHRMGPCVVSLWTHPDVGNGLFFVVLSPTPGATTPNNQQFTIGVQPANGRLKEVRYPMHPSVENGQLRYSAWPRLDRQELWRVNLYLVSTAGNDQATATVEATPPGFGQWDLLFFSLPFLGIAVLWFIGLRRKKTRRSRQASASSR